MPSWLPGVVRRKRVRPTIDSAVLGHVRAGESGGPSLRAASVSLGPVILAGARYLAVDTRRPTILAEGRLLPPGLTVTYVDVGSIPKSRHGVRMLGPARATGWELMDSAVAFKDVLNACWATNAQAPASVVP